MSNSLSSLWQMVLMAVQYMRGRKLRTALTTLSIVFGVALIFAMNITLPAVLDVFQRAMGGSSGTADLNLSSVTGESFAADPVLQTVRGVSGIRAASGVLHRSITLPSLIGGSGDTFGKSTQIELVGVDPTSQVREHVVSEGRFLQPGDIGKALVPAALAALAPNLKVGATFPLLTAGGLRLYTVIGLLAEQGSSQAPTITISLSDAQAAVNQPGLVNAVEASIVPGADRDAVQADALKALGPRFQAKADPSQQSIYASTQVGYAIFNALGIIALFLGAFLIFNTFRTLIIERRHDIAMLRVIGATRRQITWMILTESVLQGVLGTVIGLVFGFLLSMLLAAGFNQLLKQLMGGISLTPVMTVSAVASASFLGILTALVAGYWPARGAARISPLEGLRPASVAVVNRAARWGLIGGLALAVLGMLLLISSGKNTAGGALLVLIGLVIAAPGLVLPIARLFSPLLTMWYAREGDLARGNLTRQPGRAAITASTLMIGLATFITMAALVTSFGNLINTLTDRSLSSDVILVPPVLAVYNSVLGADSSLEQKLRAIPSVQTVSGLRYANATSNAASLQVLGIDPENYQKISGLEFVNGDPAAIYAALGSGRNLIINSILASQLKVNVGNDIPITTPEGVQTYHIVGIGNDILSFKLATVFVSHANLQADFHKTEDVLVMMTLKPGADKSAALADVNKVLVDYPQLKAQPTSEYKGALLQYSAAGLGAFYLIGLLILIPAVLGLLNTLTINVMERTREIGIVRAVGGSRRQIRRMVTAESLLLGLFGAATGVLAGLAMSYGFIAAFSTLGWKLPYEFPLFGVVAALVLAVLLALFAAVLPARNAAKLNIVRALQYE